MRAKPAPDDPLSSVGSALNGPTSSALSGVSIFDSRAPGSGDSGPVSGRYTRPPGPVTTSLPANVALGRGRSAGMALNSIGMTFARIPAGVFMMGAHQDDDHRFVGDELPQHFVRINRPFFMSVFQVTQAEFERVTGRNPSYFNKDRKGGPSHPVESVSWFEAEQFCAQLSALPAEVTAARRYVLPTEAEWEYACRAGTRTAFWCGPRLTTDVANFTTGREKHNTTVSGGTQPVGQYRPNVWGLYDMHGNVEEWVHDWFDDKYYANTPVDDPTGPESGSSRVTRGGCWQSFATECRSAARSASPPERGLSRIGFRVVMLEKER
ncbi:formylglycine-generating enzyme family protein [Frigoriglobus tundricola]|uniref:formylglycine-generating enzyme family protein n=1 Tax=Frigoriglobus tundricola TaxID=2774151 RepID=UPI00148EB285|nr:formylglycine-generating enzyme family protein [Frigoriglobus tundricola]